MAHMQQASMFRLTTRGVSRILVPVVSLLTLVSVDARLTDLLSTPGYYDGGDFDDLVLTLDDARVPLCEVAVTAADDPRGHEVREHPEAPARTSHWTRRTRSPPAS